MKRVLPFAAIAVFSSCLVYPPGEIVVGDGKLTEWTREVQPFLRIDNQTSLPVFIKEGSPQKVTSSLDGNLQDLVSIEVFASQLRIDVHQVRGITHSQDAKIEIVMPDFQAAKVEGSGPMKIEGVTGAKDLLLSAYGSGDITFSGTAHQLEVLGYGSSDFQLWGSGDFLRVQVFGSGDVDARRFDAHSASLSTSSSGDILANLTGGKLDVKLTGSGNVDVYGTGTLGVIDDRGAGRFVPHWDLSLSSPP